MMKNLLIAILPPILTNLLRYVFSFFKNGPESEWEYIGTDWSQVSHSPSDRWDKSRVAEVMREQWPVFTESLHSPKPFGLSNESIWQVADDRNFHNDVMTFGYVLALTHKNTNDPVSVLDWGGSVGHYYKIAKSLFPSLDLSYHVQEVASLAELGRELNPEVQFLDSDAELNDDEYDLVVSSSSIHYCQNWQGQLEEFARLSKRYVFITRFPVVKGASFVFKQKPKRFGYDTEYAAWCFNKSEFLSEAAKAGLILKREFLLLAKVALPGISEPMQFSGYLFSTQA